MKKNFCCYCGSKLGTCYCEEENKFDIEEYENNPEIQLGWAQQDLMDSYRRER